MVKTRSTGEVSNLEGVLRYSSSREACFIFCRLHTFFCLFELVMPSPLLILIDLIDPYPGVVDKVRARYFFYVLEE